MKTIKLTHEAEIKPCPLCGLSDDLEICDRDFYNRLLEEHGSARMSIRCPNCDLEAYAYSFNEGVTDYDELLWRLIERWNHRRG